MASFSSGSLHLVRCDHTFIRNISIYGDFDSPNNDGIDIEDSNNTFITNCHIDTGDDAICPKSSTGPVHNLIVTDCWIRTKSSAIKLGSASRFDFRRLLFHNITIVDSHRGLAMQIRDGAVSENGVFLSGSPGGLVSNLKFKDINLTYKRWTNYPGGLFDYRPGCRGMVKHQTAGMTMEHISGLEMENVKMRWHRSNVKGWNNPLWIRPSTVDKLSFKEWASEIC
ncbi:Glycosyl hydrolases family 28 [Musa troglodytarum]|uniref:Glycosyl hydrolases family 28 n=1 Tax=Musa troglodytarum TaxID=320322 RepID=A0A9E7JVB6_9LILI|nr:Glycosyl hydrolases family 28 [Musa troglodytarum]